MLSICIPIFNTDCNTMVLELVDQTRKENIDVEILLLDDASTESMDFSQLKVLPEVQFHQNQFNLGRAKSRNILSKLATKKYLLFLDGDAKVDNPNFIKLWIDCIDRLLPSVSYGGSQYQLNKPASNQYLRWKVSVTRESLSLEKRQRKDYGFKTNNFLIQKEIMNSIHFDERLVAYGHEDTLFGYQLKEALYHTTQIENPVMNPILDSNSAFLLKTEEGILNLKRILGFQELGINFGEKIRLIKFYYQLKKYRGLIFIDMCSCLFVKYLHAMLVRGRPFLLVFKYDLYKLILLHKALK